MMSDDAHAVQKLLRDAHAGMPVTIESGLSDPKPSATSKLKWVEIALRVFRGPVGRPATALELENKRKVTRTLREAVPALEKICDEHRSERLRNTAARYLQYIESEVGRSDGVWPGAGRAGGGSPARAPIGRHMTARKPDPHR